MFKLKLLARSCISCGICMDVCVSGAIQMRRWRFRTVEGVFYSYAKLQSARNPEMPVSDMMSFPYLGTAAKCNGCRECVLQCPVSALVLHTEAIHC